MQLKFIALICLGTCQASAQLPQTPASQPAGNASSTAVPPSDQRLGVGFIAQCSRAEAGESVFSEQKLVEFVCGSCPMVLAAPHGGRLSPHDFPARTNADAVTVSDWNTDLLARSICSAISLEGHVRPHLIICHARRRLVDVNRPLDAACSANSPARAVWQDYQDAISVATEMVAQSHGRGLFVELHGHGHPEQRFELGYLLRSRDYELPPTEFMQLSTRSSLREITERGNVTLDELLRGSQSLGFFLAKQGLPSMPSPDNPRPGKLPYFNGGWNTLTHGSRDAGTISSLQIECHRSGVRDSTEEVAVSSKKIALALLEFLDTHYPRNASNVAP